MSSKNKNNKEVYVLKNKLDFKNIVKEINKTVDEKTFTSPSQQWLASDVKYWFSTGDDVADLYISNRKHGGIPGNRIVQLNGLQQSGKSLVCAHLIKSCQQQGGIPILIDTEGSVNKQFMNAIGVDVESVIISEDLKTMEKIYSYLEKIAYVLRNNYPDIPILFIIDSITAALTQKDIQNIDYENKGYNAGLKAKQHSEALRKWSSLCTKLNICLIETSQLRADMNVMNPYMDKYQSSSGGMALQFYASLRLRLKKKSKIKQKVNNVETVVGVRSSLSVQKSRIGPSYRECEFDVYYDSGIANYTNWLETLKKFKVIDGKGTKNLPFKITRADGSIIEMPNGKFQQVLRENQEIKKQIYQVLAQLIIMKYKDISEVQGRQVTLSQQEED